MKKLGIILGISALSTSLSYAQLIDEKNVTVTMDLQPVLQLSMTTPDQIEFVFDEIREYYGGIIKYGATILRVSSSVSWDLYAVGTSQTAAGGGGLFWDQQMAYSTSASPNSINTLPLSALELHQYPNNPYAATSAALYTDYSGIFQPTNVIPPAAIGQNSIFESATPYTAPANTEKYIIGTQSTGPGDGSPGGSYLTAGGLNPANPFYFIIDYRIVPGLPAIFPFAGTNAGVSEDLVTLTGNANAYAQPGVYTMNVKYVLLEDQ
ncbi:MAG: hypothetical protein OHK0036_19030 [Bacteroidia bacterium]